MGRTDGHIISRRENSLTTPPFCGLQHIGDPLICLYCLKTTEYIKQERGTSDNYFYSDECPSMKRTYFPGITDVVVVTDPAEIRTISNDSRFDRDFIGHGPVRNTQRLRKMLRIFSLNGRLFPTMLPRTNPSRAAAQDELWSRLNVKADEVKHGPAQLEPLAEWVRGIGTAEKVALLVQLCIGRLFVETFTATEESSAAAGTVLEAASSSNILKMLWWRISGRLKRAKTLLGSMVNGDLAAVIALMPRVSIVSRPCGPRGISIRSSRNRTAELP